MSGLQGLGGVKTGAATGSGSGHFSALQSMASVIDSTSNMLNVRQKLNNYQVQRQNNKEALMFNTMQNALLAPKMWTFGAFLNYERILLEAVGGNKWRNKVQSSNPGIERIQKEIRVLEAMTVVELESNCRSIFTAEAIKLIAEKANTDTKFVKKLIQMWDSLKGDRRWYQILKQQKRRLPVDFEDREIMAAADRQYTPDEEFMIEEMRKVKQRGSKVANATQFTSIQNRIYRYPSKSCSRWATQPPRHHVRMENKPFGRPVSYRN